MVKTPWIKTWWEGCFDNCELVGVESRKYQSSIEATVTHRGPLTETSLDGWEVGTHHDNFTSRPPSSGEGVNDHPNSHYGQRWVTDYVPTPEEMRVLRENWVGEFPTCLGIMEIPDEEIWN